MKRVRSAERSTEPVADVEPSANSRDILHRLITQSLRSDVVRVKNCQFSAADCERAAVILAEYVARGDGLKILQLQLGVGINGLSCFYGTLTRNCRTLVSLDLARNRIDASAVPKLAGVVESFTSLRSMNMSYNPVGDAVAVLLRVLVGLVTIETTVFNHCCITDTGAEAIAELLASARGKRITLSLNRNRVGSRGLRLLREALPPQIGLSVSSQLLAVIKK